MEFNFFRDQLSIWLKLFVVGTEYVKCTAKQILVVPHMSTNASFTLTSVARVVF